MRKLSTYVEYKKAKEQFQNGLSFLCIEMFLASKIVLCAQVHFEV